MTDTVILCEGSAATSSPQGTIVVHHAIHKQISDYLLHTGTLCSMVNRRVGVLAGLVILGVPGIAQFVINADLVAVLVKVETQCLAGDIIHHPGQ